MYFKTPNSCNVWICSLGQNSSDLRPYTNTKHKNLIF